MRKATEILRLRWEQQLRVRQVAQSLSISHSTVIDTIYRAKAAGLSWPLPASLDNAALEALLYHGQETGPRRRVHVRLRLVGDHLRACRRDR